MDRTCGRAFFSFLSVCVWGDSVTMGGAGALVEMSTASTLNGTKTWIETSKQPLWARLPPPFFAVPWLCDGQQAPAQVCPCVCVCVILFGSLLFSDCYMHFLAAMRAVWISKCVFLPGCAFCLMRRCVRVRFKEQTAGCRYNWSRGSDSLLSPSELSAGSLWQGWKWNK